ncbi:MAG TPA: dihydroorotase [Bacillota bacterium]|nr:dihydroorotase [Bacillota bacterium]
MKLLIKGARLLDPANGVDTIADLIVNGATVEAVGNDLAVEDDAEVIDASGKLLIPGLVDIHVHLREPGREHKETILTGGRAAAAGGFTTVCAMPNTAPPMDSPEVLALFREKADAAPVRCFPIAAITVGQLGVELTPAEELVACGAVAFSDDGEPVKNSAILLKALQIAQKHGRPLVLHCEDKDLAGKGAMHEGPRSHLLGLSGIPGASEDAMVGRDLAIAASTGAHVHIAHVSTAVSLGLIRQAKQAGVNVTCEVTPHHLTLTDEAVELDATNTKMNPPLRTHKDMEALRAGLLDRTVDCIATDHAPHHADEKNEAYAKAPFGIVGLETAWPVLMTELVATGLLPLPRLVELMTSSPAKVFGVPCGGLVAGAVADLTLVDPGLTRAVDVEKFYSKSTCTPYIGRELHGWPVLTVVNGKIVMKEGVVYA